jgi:hypothetical protein
MMQSPLLAPNSLPSSWDKMTAIFRLQEFQRHNVISQLGVSLID